MLWHSFSRGATQIWNSRPNSASGGGWERGKAKFSNFRLHGAWPISSIGPVVSVLDLVSAAVVRSKTRTRTLRVKHGRNYTRPRFIAIILALGCTALAFGAEPEHAYKTGFSVAIKLGGDLHDALPQKYSDQIDAQAITLQAQDAPLIAPVATSDDSHVQRQVELSAGFIDLINHLCHAKAADKIQKGFYNDYIANLAHTYAGNPAAPIPAITDARFWTDDALDDATGFFNQIMGMLMAINMSHHYLGYYAKYSAKLTGAGDKLQPINNFLTPVEWNAAVKAGALDGLNCALGTDGIRMLFDALDKMPTRPAWAAFIVPAGTDLKKLNKELAKFEDDFFHGKIKQ